MNRKFRVSANNEIFEIVTVDTSKVYVNGQEISIDLRPLGNGLYSLQMDGRVFNIFVYEDVRQSDTDLHIGGKELIISIGSREYRTTVDDEVSLLRKSFSKPLGASSGTIVVRAPMPGLVVKVDVKLGDYVKAGQAIVVLEAMKMENEIRAPEDGKIQTLHANPGLAVEKGEPLLMIMRE